MDWLRENWFWILVLVGVILLHAGEAVGHRHGPDGSKRKAGRHEGSHDHAE